MILAAALIATLPPTFSPDPATTIWTTTPAKSFIESSPLGNGRVGAMVFGGVGHERVVLNESTMWSGSPQNADRKDAYQDLPKIRDLFLSGENFDANKLTQKTFVCKGHGSAGAAYGKYQTLCDLVIDSPEKNPTDYRRVLDLDRAIATVSYRSNAATCTKEAFVSAPANTFVYRYRTDSPAGITFDAQLSRSEQVTTHADGQDFVIEGDLDSGQPGTPGVRFSGRLRVITEGGSSKTDDQGIHIKGAKEATILFSAGTSMFDKLFEPGVKKRLDTASAKPFVSLEQEHVKDYQKFFHRVAIKLPDGPSASQPTPARLAATSHGEDDPSLAALYFNFGRYLLISGSRPDSPLPNNLQGIWAEEVNTPWNADFHLDINVEMNYWPAEVTNLGDCTAPFMKLIGGLVPNGKKTAKAYYNAHGWVAHTITNPWGYTSPGEAATWGSAPTGGAWLCEHLWDHFAFNGDHTYLQSVYPIMKGAAEFFLDALMEEPKHHWLVTCPSDSPENSYMDAASERPLAVCVGPTMDTEIIRELFSNVIQASNVLGTDTDFRKRLVATLARLAPIQVGKHGQVMEWLQDYEESEPHHRHLSQLYALYPSNQITVEKTPALAKAAVVTLERRGDDGVGWSLAWKTCCQARLRNGDHAWKLLKTLFRPVTDTSIRNDGGGGTYPNLLDACPPFQIDGNFGATAGIAEMLLQSRDGEIFLLPALPKAWKTGQVTGLRARGGLTVDIHWKDGKVTSYQVTGQNSKKVKVHFPQ